MVLDSGLERPTGLAVDWVAQRLYVVDAGLDRIEVCELSGRQRSVLIWEGIEKPRDIVLDPVHG